MNLATSLNRFFNAIKGERFFYVLLAFARLLFNLHASEVSYNNSNTLYLKRVARNSYKTSNLVALYLKLQQV